MIASYLLMEITLRPVKGGVSIRDFYIVALEEETRALTNTFCE